ncbi:KGGVGR-motif variant AAA ATPase [Tateyamaria armeniaca]|uniref:KGGVGR-motif variant AAA ATPase n=1 Tax=Tateyamaria armeniaca TaxID=2518930 RepID=A0ABW8UXD3_9RHOB
MQSNVKLDGFDLRPAQENAPQSQAPLPQPGKIYTFYSFKGGVGRSMAMANIAVLLAAQGKKVLIVDFDLEAPGLEHFFHNHDESLQERLMSRPGLIDLLNPDPIDWRDTITNVPLELEALSFTPSVRETSGRLDMIHSGRAARSADAYTQAVQSLNWDELYTKHDIGTRFGTYRGEWLAEYDYVLIDSRTGVTDIGDLCTVVLPDHLVLLFVTNQQNISGISQIYDRAVSEHAKQPFDRARLTVLPVLSRDEFYSENTLSREWRQRAANQLEPLFRDWLPEGLRPVDAFQKLFIPYFAFWSFGEALPVLTNPEEAANPSSINAAYSRLARLIFADLDWSSLDAQSDPAELSTTRIIQKKELEETFISQQVKLDRERAEIEARQREQEEQLARSIEDLARARELNEAKVSRRSLWAVILGVSVVAALIVTSLSVSLRQNADTIEAALVAERASAVTTKNRIEELTAELEIAREETRAAEARIADWQSRSTDVARQFSQCQEQIATAETQFRRYASEVQKSIRSAIGGVPFCNVIAPLVEQIADPDRYIESFKR